MGNEPRQLTWAEKEFLSMLEASAPDEGPIESIYQLPHAFWEAIVQATDYYVLEVARPPAHEESTGWRNQWKRWEKEFTWHTGLGVLKDHPWNEFQLLVLEGRTSARSIPGEYVHPAGHQVVPALRLSALEFLLDVCRAHPDFEEQLNERAEFLNVGLRMSGKRFIPMTSAPLHENLVKPVAAILTDPRFAASEELFSLAANKARLGDFEGAITAAWQSTDEALKLVGSSLEHMGQRARTQEGITPAVADLINQLQRLRYRDAAGPEGVIDLHTAMLAIHVSGSLITYLANRLR